MGKLAEAGLEEGFLLQKAFTHHHYEQARYDTMDRRLIRHHGIKKLESAVSVVMD